MALLRDIQKDTGGFTEFVPLSFIHSEAPMYSKRLVPDVRPGATGAEVIRMHALARLMLGRHSATSRRRGSRKDQSWRSCCSTRAPTTSAAR